MNGYNFTERVRKVLGYAREEAVRLRHEYVGTEHVLLGLIREREGLGSTVLENLGVDLDALGNQIEGTVKWGKADQNTGPDLPYTSRAKKVLELSMSEARELDHTYVGTEHLLLGLIREKSGIAAQVLVDAGATLDKARAETIRLLGDPPSSRPEPGASLPQPIAMVIAEAFKISKERGRTEPGVADLLQALVFSSREVAAAFAARDIEFQGLILEIRGLLSEQ